MQSLKKIKGAFLAVSQVIAVAVLSGGIPQIASAAVKVYECTFPYERARGRGWIPEFVSIRDEQPSGKAMVFDPLIREFGGVPIEARRAPETRARTGFSWDLPFDYKGQSAVMQYTLTMYKDGRPAKLTAKPIGYDNSFDGSGTCVVKGS